MKTHFLKYYLFYALLFLLLFLEDRIFLMGISLSNIWKISTVFILLLLILWRKIRTGSISYFDISVLFLSLSFLVNGHGLCTMDDIEELLLILIFPISYYSFYYLYGSNSNKLKSELLVFSIFLVLTSVPFLLDIIKPVSDFNESREKFVEGFELNSQILVGFFKQPSISSKVFVFSSIIIWIFGIHQITSSIRTKGILLLILALGIYDVYLSFTRTGWLMLIAFIFIFTFLSKNKSSLKKIFFIFFIVVSLIYIYSSNATIKNRILGNNLNKTSQAGDINNISSGRTILMVLAINSVLEDSRLSLFLGLGKKDALEKNSGALAHNRFVEIFTFGGLISLFLYLIYLFRIYKEIQMRKTDDMTYTLSISLYFIMILALIPSHGLALWADVIFGGIVALNRIEFETTEETQLIQPQS